MRLEKLLPTRFLFVVLLLILSAGFADSQTVRATAGDTIKRGNAHHAKAEYGPAIAEYESISPDAGEKYAQALYNIGVCYFELWRTEDAVQQYGLAIAARKGSYPGAHYALGVALEELKRPAEAKEAYRQSIATSHGKHVPAHYRLGLLTAYEHDYEAAADLFKQAIVLSRDRLPASHNNLGVMLALTGRLTEARREFETAVRQTHGELPEAGDNLKLCRALLLSATVTEVASLRLTETTARGVGATVSP